MSLEHWTVGKENSMDDFMARMSTSEASHPIRQAVPDLRSCMSGTVSQSQDKERAKRSSQELEEVEACVHSRFGSFSGASGK